MVWAYEPGTYRDHPVRPGACARSFQLHWACSEIDRSSGRGDVFAESTFAKQIALIEADKIPPIVAILTSGNDGNVKLNFCLI